MASWAGKMTLEEAMEIVDRQPCSEILEAALESGLWTGEKSAAGSFLEFRGSAGKKRIQIKCAGRRWFDFQGAHGGVGTIAMLGHLFGWSRRDSVGWVAGECGHLPEIAALGDREEIEAAARAAPAGKGRPGL